MIHSTLSKLISFVLAVCLAVGIPSAGFAEAVRNEAGSTSPHYQNRQEISAKYKWRLEDIYKDQREWQQDMQKTERLAKQLQGMAGHMGDSVEQLKKALDLYVELNRVFEKTYAYAKLSFHTNKSDSEFQRLSSSAEDLSVKVGEYTSFFIPELLSIPKGKMQNFINDPLLRDYQRWIHVQLASKDHTLPKEMEQVLAKSGAMANMPESIYSMLTKDMTFPMIRDESGREVKLTPANYGALIQSENRHVRERAYKAYYQTINQYKDTFAQILQAEVKKNIFYADVRKYHSSREASMEVNNIPLSVYDNLISAVHEELPMFHHYIELKRKAAGYEKMSLYDLYIQLGRKEEHAYIPFELAKKRVKEGLAVLGEDYARLLDRAFNERWIDVYYTPGKRTGAYQWGAYDVHPFILLNYTGDMDDVFTLAHEFGHAAQSYFSNQKQSYLNAAYPIFTAEVASTTNEALLFHEMYKKAKSKDEKIKILSQRLEDYGGTLFLQTMFAEFEKIIHEKAEKGDALTADVFSKVYGDLLQKYYGEALSVDSAATLGWARIPHFYRNYYVYQYATGFACANVFAEQIMNKGKPAVDRYITKFLSAGNSKDPIDVLKDAGVDMRSPEVIRQALKGFEQTLKELERLLG